MSERTRRRSQRTFTTGTRPATSSRSNHTAATVRTFLGQMRCLLDVCKRSEGRAHLGMNPTPHSGPFLSEPQLALEGPAGSEASALFTTTVASRATASLADSSLGQHRTQRHGRPTQNRSYAPLSLTTCGNELGGQVAVSREPRTLPSLARERSALPDPGTPRLFESMRAHAGPAAQSAAWPSAHLLSSCGSGILDGTTITTRRREPPESTG